MRTSKGPIPYPLYAAGLATSLCGLAALNSGASDKSLAVLAGTLLCAGYAVSITLRRFNCNARLLELAVAAAAVAIYVQVVSVRDIGAQFLPVTILDSPELQLASLLLWLEVLRSFTLVSDEAVVFSAIPSIVLISLAATSNVNPEIAAFFVLYLALAAFLLCHKPGLTGSRLRSTFRVALITAGLALTVGCAVVIPVRVACINAFSAAMPGFINLGDQAILSSGDGNFLQIAQGPVHLSERVVMTVAVDKRSVLGLGNVYWRGKVFDRYTGHGWRSSSVYITAEPRKWQANSDGNPVWKFGNRIVSSDRMLRQRFLLGPVGGTIYGAAEIAAIIAPTEVLRHDRFNCWQGIRYNPMGTVYTVISELPIVAPRKLRLAGDDYPADVREQGLQVLMSTAKAGDLAREITSGMNSPYTKVLAIESYLGRHYTYDLDAPRAPATADAVNYFLFTSRRGYCDVFASAMVIMCREIGVPARLATGFTSGTYDPDQGWFLVRDKDRHAWAEVYFPRCGWVAFDPTSWTIETDEDWLGTAWKSIERMVGEVLGGSAALPAAVAILAGCLAAAFAPELLHARLRSRSRSPSRLHSMAVAQCAAVLRSIRVRDAYLTPLEAAASAARLSPTARDVALQAAALFGEIRYGSREVTVEDVDALRSLVRQLRSAVRRRTDA